MTDHYYTAEPQSKHDIQEITFNYQGKTLSFITDAGVFSKKRVDYGSELLIKTVTPAIGARILDIGCGYGPIGLCYAAQDTTAHVTLLDINTRAVDLARRNAERNHLNNVKIIVSDGFLQVDEKFDIIVMNPPIRAGKQVIYPIFEQSINYLNNKGIFYIVIQKKQGGGSAMTKLTEIYGNCDKIAKSGGFWVLQAINQA